MTKPFQTASSPVIYIDGRLADHIGGQALTMAANMLATLASTPVDMLTHGTSEYHSRVRFVGEPAEGVDYRQAMEGLRVALNPVEIDDPEA